MTDTCHESPSYDVAVQNFEHKSSSTTPALSFLTANSSTTSTRSPYQQAFSITIQHYHKRPFYRNQQPATTMKLNSIFALSIGAIMANMVRAAPVEAEPRSPQGGGIGASICQQLTQDCITATRAHDNTALNACYCSVMRYPQLSPFVEFVLSVNAWWTKLMRVYSAQAFMASHIAATPTLHETMSSAALQQWSLIITSHERSRYSESLLQIRIIFLVG